MTTADLLVDQVAFLVTASDDEVQPDVALAQLEAIIAGILELDADELGAVRAILEIRASIAVEPVKSSLLEMLDMLT